MVVGMPVMGALNNPLQLDPWPTLNVTVPATPSVAAVPVTLPPLPLPDWSAQVPVTTLAVWLSVMATESGWELEDSSVPLHWPPTDAIVCAGTTGLPRRASQPARHASAATKQHKRIGPPFAFGAPRIAANGDGL